MARKSKKQKKYQFNEHDENQVRALRDKKRKQKKKIRLKRIRIILEIIIIIAFLISPYSKAKKVTVKGNYLVNTSQITKASKIDTTNYFFVEWFRIESIKKRINQLNMIESSNVSIDLVGNVNIKVEECPIVAWGKVNKTTYLIGKDGSVIKSNKKVDLLGLTKVSNFKKLSLFKKFSKNYASLPILVRNDVSDAIYSPKKCDETRMELRLNDGKIIYIRIENMVERLNEKDYDAYMQSYGDHDIFSFEGDSLYMSKKQQTNEESEENQNVSSTDQTSTNNTQQNTNNNAQ